MDEGIKKFLDEVLNLERKREYHFRNAYGLTFAFKSEITHMGKNITSASIVPVGIIYEENDEYIFAPLYGKVKINEVIAEYVKTF